MKIIKLMFLNMLMLSTLLLATIASADVVGKMAPDFDLIGVAGKSVKLSDYKGRVIYLDFWASWCSPCRDSFPWMSALAAKYKNQGVTFIAINVDRKQQDAEKFLQATPANFVVAFDAKGVAPKQYEVMGMPSAYVIGKDGKILHSHIGFNLSDISEYERHITTAMKQ